MAQVAKKDDGSASRALIALMTSRDPIISQVATEAIVRMMCAGGVAAGTGMQHLLAQGDFSGF